MSNWYGFLVLPFDWRVAPQSKVQLPIDIDDFAQELRSQCPCGEVVIKRDKDSASVLLYVLVEPDDPWVAANLIYGENTQLEISAWPKKLAMQLIRWFRHYIDSNHPLFVVVLPDGTGTIELTDNTSQQDVEALYPARWVFKKVWEGC